MSRVTVLLFFFALALAGACAGPDSDASAEPTARLAPAALAGTPNVYAFDGILTAGQPTSEGLAAAREHGVRTVLNLRKSEELPYDERAAVEALGMEYIQIPWNSAAELTDEVFARTREVLNDRERPLLFHCASANRVGATWIPWRVLDGGVELETAVLEAKTLGLRSAEYEAKARDYVARHTR